MPFALLAGVLLTASGTACNAASAPFAPAPADPLPPAQTTPPPAAPKPAATATAAARLLDQASFGATLADMQHVESIGLSAYLSEQLAASPTILQPIAIQPNPTPPGPYVCTYKSYNPCLWSEWFQNSLTANDQLRQRVAFALSEIFVVSTDTDAARTIVPFHNILVQDAFGHFDQLMYDVTLSPAMGNYLNMLNSAAPPAGQIANENYARELMQLFTIGLYPLQQDGEPNMKASTFTEAQVEAFARVYTGWTLAPASGKPPTQFPSSGSYLLPMAPYEPAHDMGSKTLLTVPPSTTPVVLPAGQTAEADLSAALANIFAQPNVPPFICRQLIQHLVESAPSPQYVNRIAAVFINDGTGVRGNLGAVVQAILLDPEARAGDTQVLPRTGLGGHLREPILWTTGVIRGMGYVNNSSVGNYNLIQYTSPLGQVPYGAPSVFNFYQPGYLIPITGQNAPEFGLENTATAIQRVDEADSLASNNVSNFTADLSPTSPLGAAAATSPTALIAQLNLMFLHGQMSSDLQSQISSAISNVPGIPASDEITLATYLTITSTEYKILH